MHRWLLGARVAGLAALLCVAAIVAGSCSQQEPTTDGRGSSFTDRLVLMALYDATDGANWVYYKRNWQGSSNWLPEVPLELWAGVRTDRNGRVIRLELIHNGLRGEIPSELANLTKLRELVLYDNDLRGKIPPELGNLTNLEVLWLSDNDLSGEIPPELGNLTNLEVLFLEDNDLSGQIPSKLANLTNLEALFLENNDLSGQIPLDLNNLPDLQRIKLKSNQFTGCRPQGDRWSNSGVALLVCGASVSTPTPTPVPRSTPLPRARWGRGRSRSPLSLCGWAAMVQ